MKNAIVTAPCVSLRELENLFIEMTAKNCNLKCKHCYIEFDPYKKVKDYIPLDFVKESLQKIDTKVLRYVYLTGAEPMLHPDFNAILRLCLKKANVTIQTNGMMINDKKARFLRKVEDETTNEIVFRVSLDDYDEIRNDNLRGRGSYRKVVYGVQCLVKYGFNPVITVVNYHNQSEKELFEGFQKVFRRFNFEIEPMNLHIIPYINKNAEVEIDPKKFKDSGKQDCAAFQIFTAKGVYNCPLLANDSRGRSGANLGDFSEKAYLETTLCAQCAGFNNKLFSNGWT